MNLTPDRATRMGLDADEAEVGDVGADGVSISNLEDLSTALKDIDLEKYPVHIDAGFSGLEVLMMLVALLKKEDKRLDKIKGSIDTDPLGFLAVNGKLLISLEKAYGNMAGLPKTHRI